MLRNRFCYFLDFILCPPLILFFGWMAIEGDNAYRLIYGVSFGLMGLGAWTFVEYWVHRSLFHHTPWLRQMHAAHHEEPELLIGSPPGSLPLALIAMDYVLLSWLGQAIFAATCAGLLTGYFIYSFVHFATHHPWRDPIGYLASARRWHMVHHYGPAECNFGVTTQMWDNVFATSLRARALRRARRA